MSQAPRPGLPYHRVVAAGGRLGGYGGAEGMKAALLRAEGIVVRGTKIADFARVRGMRTEKYGRSLAKPRRDSPSARSRQRREPEPRA
jgi:hypothetical protein